jgi:hypothetical protein
MTFVSFSVRPNMSLHHSPTINLVDWHYPRSRHHWRFKTPLHCRILNRLTSLSDTRTASDVLQDCRFIAQPGIVSWANTAGSGYNPAVIGSAILPPHNPSRQCCWSHHCRLDTSRQWSIFRILLFYIIYFYIFWWNRVSRFILQVKH